MLSSLYRRLIPIRGNALDTSPFGFDKPSNSLFIPPEYRSVNCYVCSANTQGVSVLIGDQLVSRQPTEIGIVIDGICVTGPNSPPIPYRQQDMWQNKLRFGDGESTEFGSGYIVNAPHTFDRAGTYNVEDDVSCYCNSPFVVSYGSSMAIVLCSNRKVTSYADVLSCPRLRQSNANYDINGCTASPDIVEGVVFGTVQRLIPVGSEDTVEGYPCNQHDLCFETCGSVRADCDDRFEQDMLDACGTNNECKRKAINRARDVRIVGIFAFRREQKEHCLCCD